MKSNQLYVASITPITSSEEINFSALEAHFDYLAESGVTGITFCGTTGEFPALRDNQRSEVLTFAVGHNKNRVKVMAGVGGNTTRQAILNCQMAERIGVDSVLLLTPWFEKTGLEAISSYVDSVCHATDLPVYLYHHPFRTNFDWPVEHILDLASKHTGKIVGIKDSSCDFNRMKQYSISKDKNFQVFFECPDQFDKASELGAVGSIDGLANLIPEESVKAMNGCSESKKNYSLVRNVLASSNNYIGLIRFGLEQMGMNPGSCFAPNLFVRSEEKKTMIEALESIGRLSLSKN